MKINNQQTNTSFSGIIPVKVSIRPLVQQHIFDFKSTTDKKLIEKTCNRVVKIIAGQTNAKRTYNDTLLQLAKLDKDYSYQRAVRGYCTKGYDPFGNVINETPSDYFRILNDEAGNTFITTGRESQDLAQCGINIGRARRTYNKTKTQVALSKLEAALKDYGNKVKDMLSNPALRLSAGEKKTPCTLNVVIDEVMVGKRKKTLKHAISNMFISAN